MSIIQSNNLQLESSKDNPNLTVVIEASEIATKDTQDNVDTVKAIAQILQRKLEINEAQMEKEKNFSQMQSAVMQINNDISLPALLKEYQEIEPLIINLDKRIKEIERQVNDFDIENSNHIELRKLEMLENILSSYRRTRMDHQKYRMSIIKTLGLEDVFRKSGVNIQVNNIQNTQNQGVNPFLITKTKENLNDFGNPNIRKKIEEYETINVNPKLNK